MKKCQWCKNKATHKTDMWNLCDDCYKDYLKDRRK